MSESVCFGPGDFITAIDTVAAVTADGPLGATLRTGAPDAPPTMGWVYADSGTKFTTVELVALGVKGAGQLIGATVCDARYTPDGPATHVARYITETKAALSDRQLCSRALARARSLHDPQPESLTVFGRMLEIANAVLSVNLPNVQLRPR